MQDVLQDVYAFAQEHNIKSVMKSCSRYTEMKQYDPNVVLLPCFPQQRSGSEKLQSTSQSLNIFQGKSHDIFMLTDLAWQMDSLTIKIHFLRHNSSA